jgi:hypothetical protein
MHPEILSEEQKTLLPLFKKFQREFYLVGGTAIALQIGHRQSIYLNQLLFNRKKYWIKSVLINVHTW